MQKKTPLKKAFLRKYPESVVLVTSVDRDGRANVMAVGWIAMASLEPPMFVLGIDDEAHTYRLIRRTRQFVVAFPSTRMIRETLFVGSCHGQGRDKFTECGLAMQKALQVRAPLVADAVANFECTLEKIYQPGDCPLVVGRIVAAHENINCKVTRLCSIGPRHRLGAVSIQR